jgi:hypothetical protein
MILQLALLAGGCVSPDRWTDIDNLYFSETSQTDEYPASIALPEQVQSQLAEEPASTFPGEGTIDLSIEQASTLVLKNNRDLHVRQLNPVIAGTFEQIERGVYDPEVFAELEYGKAEEIETSRSSRRRYSPEIPHRHHG